MKNIVTFETAKKLKEAGFPQPEPERGQVWYNEDKDLGVLGNCISATFDFTWCSVGDNYDGHDDHYENADSILKEYVFAPAATDILRHINKSGYLDRWVNRFMLSRSISYIADVENDVLPEVRANVGIRLSYIINPEKVAKSWLALLEPEDAIASGEWDNVNEK